MDSVTLSESWFALSVNVSVKLNTVYSNVVFNKITFAQSKPIHFSIRALKLEKMMGQKLSREILNR